MLVHHCWTSFHKKAHVYYRHFLLHFFCPQIVYFKKLTAIKDLVDLMKVVQAQVDMPANTPKDLISLIFSNDSSQVLDTIQDTGHNPFSSQWNPPDQPDATPHPDDPGFEGGFFCMPCFHRYRKILPFEEEVKDKWQLVVHLHSTQFCLCLYISKEYSRVQIRRKNRNSRGRGKDSPKPEKGKEI